MISFLKRSTSGCNCECHSRFGYQPVAVSDVCQSTLLQMVTGKASKERAIHIEVFRFYDSIVHLGYQKHFGILHSDEKFAEGSNHINGIEGFWGYAKVRLSRIPRMSKNTFYLNLKDCEFRVNYRNKNLYSLLLKITKDNGLI